MVDFVEEGNSHSPFCNSKVISQPYRSFEMRGTVLQNGTRVPKSGFAVEKHPAEWGFGCEKWDFLRFGISQPFRSYEMRFTVLRNGTRVPKVGFAVAKYPAKWSFGCEIGIFHVLELRSRFAAVKWGLLCCEMALVCPKLVSQL